MRKAQLAFAVVCLSAFLSTPSGAATEKVLHAFTGGLDGGNPQGILVRDSAGNLYGVTQHGGASSASGKPCYQSYGCGVVFELSPLASGKWKETILHNFCVATGCNDGANPVGGLVVDSNGNLYGATYNGGVASAGVVFEMSVVDGKWVEKVIHHFCTLADCHDGQFPDAGLILDGEGNLYGTTIDGGDGAAPNGFGAAFELSPSTSGGWVEKVLHRFCASEFCPDGADPRARLAFDKEGNLYSTVIGGGTKSEGLVYELKHSATVPWPYTVLYNFCSLSSCSDGEYPIGGVTFNSAGDMFGTAYYGGAKGDGVVYELVLSSGKWEESAVHSFCTDKSSGGACLDGSNPVFDLVFDSSGDIYGVTQYGATNNGGVLYKLTHGTEGWAESVLHGFCVKAGCPDGNQPAGTPIFDEQGNIYGVTGGGGTGNATGGAGVVYEVIP